MNSISDTQEYRSVCINAANDDECFRVFKRNPIYNGILEHVSESQGNLYLNYIKNNSPELLDIIEKFKENDIHGDTVSFAYPEIGYISPSTLRYIKVLSDIKNIFGDITGKKIIEIGAGYGGQCLVLNKLFAPSEYAIVDLDESSELSNKYLKLHGINPRIIKISEIDNIDEDFDIVISNYAYSELNIDLQDLYYDKIIKRSKNGYLTYNFISNISNINSYNKVEVFNKFAEKNIKTLDELPKTFDNNLIIYF
jgi:ribosomal protein RSM22 (predicted rRNA methylase)